MNRIGQVLLTVILAELALGGGGRLTAIGPISFRMILFALAGIATLICLFQSQKISFTYWRLCILFGVVLTIGLVRGILSGAEKAFWWEDVKPLLYFFILPFLAYTLTDNKVIDRSATIIRLSGVVLAALFLIALLVVHTVVPFLGFYRAVIDTQEFFFRGELTFFYKGFLFLGLSFLFLHFSGHRYKWGLMGLVFLAIFLSITRGLLLALCLTYAFYYFPRSRFGKSLLFIALAVILLVAGNYMIRSGSQLIDRFISKSSTEKSSTLNSYLLGDRNYSDEGRLQQIKEVAREVTPTSFIVGHGFGNGTASRPVHMEIAYLEIFHKQGIIGLLFWAYLFLGLITNYRAVPTSELADSFFYGSVFIILQSFTNQYVNNPIGLSIVLLSVVCLDRMKKPDPA